jgi:hypothetical protein
MRTAATERKFCFSQGEEGGGSSSSGLLSALLHPLVTENLILHGHNIPCSAHRFWRILGLSWRALAREAVWRALAREAVWEIELLLVELCHGLSMLRMRECVGAQMRTMVQVAAALVENRAPLLPGHKIVAEI